MQGILYGWYPVCVKEEGTVRAKIKEFYKRVSLESGEPWKKTTALYFWNSCTLEAQEEARVCMERC